MTWGYKIGIFKVDRKIEQEEQNMNKCKDCGKEIPKGFGPRCADCARIAWGVAETKWKASPKYRVTKSDGK